MADSINPEALFSELGRALYVFQAIEARIKFLLPYLSVPETGDPPSDEGWEGRNKYLNSKEMLGHLVKYLQQRMRVDDPERLELEWRAVVQGRNDVIHHFVQQPFSRCESPEQFKQAIEFVRARRMRALPMLQMLDSLLHGFLKALSLPPEFEGEFTLDLPAWQGTSAA